jgi:hypothetical protein
MAGTIGIKIANGDFYPITGENSPAKKRLVLTTVHDGQKSVQIDLFRSISKSMLDAPYIGSLVVENIRAKPKGEPSIEMIISSDADGNITADAYDLDSGGEHKILNVSLKTLDSIVGEDDFPDFNLDEDRPLASSGLHDKYDDKEEAGDDEKKFPWLIMGLATLFVVIAIAVLWFLFFGGREILRPSDGFANGSPSIEGAPSASGKPSAGSSVPVYEEPVTPAQPQPVQPPPPPQPKVIVDPPPPPRPPPPEGKTVQEPPVIKAPTVPPPERSQPATVRKRPPAPVSSYKVPAVIPRNGIVYQIRWGDTLWDISEAFYRNPWLYPKIARDNNIKNPDHIIAGSNVRVRPLN